MSGFSNGGSGEGAEGELVERWFRSSGDALPDEGKGGGQYCVRKRREGGREAGGGRN